MWVRLRQRGKEAKRQRGKKAKRQISVDFEEGGQLLS